jgi:hypothetical protein
LQADASRYHLRFIEMISATEKALLDLLAQRDDQQYKLQKRGRSHISTHFENGSPSRKFSIDDQAANSVWSLLTLAVICFSFLSNWRKSQVV